MSGKTLSNGTLSLRFMQNAQRAKLQATIEAEKAKVKDEAEWEVSKEVRDAWGLTSKLKAEQTVTYEASYLPFLYPPSSHGDDKNLTPQPNIAGPSQVKFMGRRVFGKEGREVSAETFEEKPRPTPLPQDFPRGQRPMTLSSRTMSTTDTKPHNGADKKFGRSSSATRSSSTPVPVLSMITDASVGTDIRSVRKLAGNFANSGSSSNTTNEQGSKLTFMRPAGVDSPVPAGKADSTKRKRVDSSANDHNSAKVPHIDSTGTSNPNPINKDPSKGDFGGPTRSKTKKAKRNS